MWGDGARNRFGGCGFGGAGGVFGVVSFSGGSGAVGAFLFCAVSLHFQPPSELQRALSTLPLGTAVRAGHLGLFSLLFC